MLKKEKFAIASVVLSIAILSVAIFANLFWGWKFLAAGKGMSMSGFYLFFLSSLISFPFWLLGFVLKCPRLYTKVYWVVSFLGYAQFMFFRASFYLE